MFEGCFKTIITRLWFRPATCGPMGLAAKPRTAGKVPGCLAAALRRSPGNWRPTLSRKSPAANAQAATGAQGFALKIFENVLQGVLREVLQQIDAPAASRPAGGPREIQVLRVGAGGPKQAPKVGALKRPKPVELLQIIDSYRIVQVQP